MKVGDWAYLSSEETQALIAQHSLSATRKYPVVIAFSEGDTLDDEARLVVPRPPLPEINRARGRIGFDYSGVPVTIWRWIELECRLDDPDRYHPNQRNILEPERLLAGADQQPVSRRPVHDARPDQSHLHHRPDLRQSKLQMGGRIRRLYLPWATSLDTIDGGYFGQRIAQGVTAGIFAGSPPDPTSWSYDPDRRLGGAFVNFEGGTFDNLRYTSTSGMGIGMLKWNIDRPFVFFENGIFYKRYLSIYHSLQADSPSGNPQVAAPGPGISRSFLTVRLQPASRSNSISITPTSATSRPTIRLVDTGLLDKYLFQGFSGGVRVQVVRDIWAYNLLGRSNRSGDAKPSWNQLYGVTVGPHALDRHAH